VAGELPRPKVWRYPKVVSEHVFDKLQLLDCTFGEFEAAIVDAEVIEDRALDDEGSLKELLLSVAWRRPLHVVVVVDERRREERMVTVYGPDPNLWSTDYRRRR
jgi:hypothetical protein